MEIFEENRISCVGIIFLSVRLHISTYLRLKFCNINALRCQLACVLPVIASLQLRVLVKLKAQTAARTTYPYLCVFAVL